MESPSMLHATLDFAEAEVARCEYALERAKTYAATIRMKLAIAQLSHDSSRSPLDAPLPDTDAMDVAESDHTQKRTKSTAHMDTDE